MVNSLLFLLTGIIGLVTLSLLIRSYRSNPISNLFLVLIISIVSFRQIVHGSYHLELQTFLKPDKGLFSIIYLLIVPSFYLYYKYLAFPQQNYNFKDLKHLIFMVFIYVVNSNEVLKNSFSFYFGALTNFYFIGMFLIVYLVMIFKLLRKQIWTKNSLLLNIKHFHLVKKWTLFLYVLNVFSSVALLFTLYKESIDGASLTGKSTPFFLLILWLLMFFKILTSPEILFGLPILNRTLLKFDDVITQNEKKSIKLGSNWILEPDIKKSNQDQKLQEKIRDNIESYVIEVDKLSSQKMIFRNQKASQNDIADALGVPTSHIVYLFKYHSKISFSEYRMNSRVQDAISLIEEGFLNTETLESLSSKTGFSSYNPFFSAFKKTTNYAPQDYLKVKKN